MASERKRILMQELLVRLRTDLERMERAQQRTVDGAISDEAKPENSKDTRALEQTYLARGQAQRVEELREGLARVAAMPNQAFPQDARVAVGALVTIDEADGESVLLIVPFGGGIRLRDGEQAVTPASPLGRALIGKAVGDDCEIAIAGRRRSFSIRAIE